MERRRRACRMLAAVAAVLLVLCLGSPVMASAEDAPDPQPTPPATLPAPPVTVQQLVNQLLPLVRQFDPVLKQVGGLVAQLDPLITAGGASAEQVDALASQLQPVVAQVAPLAAQVAAMLEPLWSTVDTQVSPQLQALLAMFGPYVNQVDLATGFQVIGPIAPTVLKAIPLSNRFYNAIDVIAPVRDPFSCPLARALPQQKVIDIVVPFLCYNTIVNQDALGSGASTPPPDLGDDTVEGGSVPAEGASTSTAEVPVESPAAGAPAPLAVSATDADGAGGSSVPSAAASSADSTDLATAPLVSSSDDAVKRLEDRLRLMAVLLVGLGLLAWSLFRPAPTDGQAGLGMFRRIRPPIGPGD